MSKELKVLMMGGQRVGKSSALAAIIESFTTGEMCRVLKAKDTTVLEENDGVKQASIASKLHDIRQVLQNYTGKTILVDSGKTSNYQNYQLELSIPDSFGKMTIHFTDINGEFFEGGTLEQKNIIELVKSYDVFIVAIDTPFMMEARQNGLVDAVINRKYNCIDSIHTVLTNIDDSDGKNAKLVIFTPIKCEKWARENQLDAVTQCVREDYATTLKALSKYKRVQVEVLPVQTIGSIVFQEHREAYKFSWTKRFLFFFEKNYTSKCAVLDDGKVRLADGREFDHTAGTIEEDIDAILIPNTDIVRPNSWFKVLTKAYKPHNCEQLAFHILDFMLSKLIDANLRNMGLWKMLVNALKNKFGGISIQKMTSIIEQLYEEDLIKNSGEGILLLNKCDFKKE